MRSQSRNRWLPGFLLLALMLPFPQPGSASSGTPGDGGILLPAQHSHFASINPGRQLELSGQTAWSQFTSAHGKWSVLWNEATRTPHRAFGPAIPLAGFRQITAQNVEAAARDFMQNNAALFKVASDELRLLHATPVNRRWYISFIQTKDSLDVLFSELAIRIFENGKIMAFGADIFPNIDVSTAPTLSLAAARENATRGIAFDPTRDFISADAQLCILPIVAGDHKSYHLVYKVEVRTSAPVANYVVLVDAHSGAIHWRHDRVREFNTAGAVRGTIQLLGPDDPPITAALQNLFIDFDGEQVTTDELGRFTQILSRQVTATARLSGPWVNVINQMDTTDARLSYTIAPGDTISFFFDDSNSTLAARDVFYHSNIIHNFITTLDPDFTNINYSMPALVHDNSNNCNARWDGNGMIFFVPATTTNRGPCTNSAQNASIIYHEYSHGINDRLYKQLGAEMGMLNGATHEGLADVGSAMILDDPGIARGFFPQLNPIRNLQNDRRYPQEYGGGRSTHENGLILAGALWDIRMATSLETFRHLAHFAKYGLPDDLNPVIAFSEWFIETLIADDDDGDLSNGTPNFAVIVDAFNRHGIGTSLFVTLSFAHSAAVDVPASNNPHPIPFALQHLSRAGELDSVRLYYSTNNFESVAALPAQPMASGQYLALIPPQPAGTLVSYYITAIESASNTQLTFPENAPVERSFNFLVGFENILVESFEQPSLWSVGAADDNAASGIWERGDPEGATIAAATLQPNEDHTADGEICFVTGANFGVTGPNYVTNGKTTLVSPLFDLSQLQDPAIRYYRWYAQVSPSTENEFWMAEISNDGGQSWVTVETTSRSSNDWERVQFKVADFVQPTKFIQMRFVASDFNRPSIVEALLDDFEILRNVNDSADQSLFPEQFAVEQNYPNPFNLETRIEFAAPQFSTVYVRIFNLLGQQVRELLVDNKQPGNHFVIWDGKSEDGQVVSSGIYFYRIVLQSLQQRFTATKKMMVLK